MALSGIGSNYGAYEGAYASQKGGSAARAADRSGQASWAQAGGGTTAAKMSASDYASYLQKTYDCVREGKASIPSAYLKKCVENPEEAKRLEESLSLFKECYQHGYENAKRRAASMGEGLKAIHIHGALMKMATPHILA